MTDSATVPRMDKLIHDEVDNLVTISTCDARHGARFYNKLATKIAPHLTAIMPDVVDFILEFKLINKKLLIETINEYPTNGLHVIIVYLASNRDIKSATAADIVRAITNDIDYTKDLYDELKFN